MKRTFSAGVFLIILLAALATPPTAPAQEQALADPFARLETLTAQAESGGIEAQRDLGLYYLFTLQDGTSALPWLEKAAARGDAPSQTAMGYLYEEGIGTAVDLKKAIAFYEQAANQDHPVAQSRLGYLLKSGAAGKKDLASAAKWLQRAASWGDAYAQANLAEMFEKGMGIAQNYSLAATWYSAAAAQSHTLAQRGLGRLYENGQGVRKDLVKAYMWYSIAGVWDSVGEDELPPDDPRRRLRKTMTPKQILEAEALATDWWIEHFQPK